MLRWLVPLDRREARQTAAARRPSMKEAEETPAPEAGSSPDDDAAEPALDASEGPEESPLPVEAEHEEEPPPPAPRRRKGQRRAPVLGLAEE